MSNRKLDKPVLSADEAARLADGAFDQFWKLLTAPPDEAIEVQRAAAAYVVPALEIKYRRSGYYEGSTDHPNPIYAWKAFRMARISGQPIPDWILDYLDTVAVGILGLADEAPKDANKQLAKALGFSSGKPGSRSSEFAAHERYQRDSYIANRVFRLRQFSPKMSANKAFGAVAKELNMELGAVKRAYKRYEAHSDSLAADPEQEA